MSHDAHPTPPPPPADIPAPLPDSENPAVIFARKTYIWTIVFAVGFIGSVLVFIL